MVNFAVTDPATGIQAEVVNGSEKNALVVATRELKIFRNEIKFFINDTYGTDMNQDIGFTGTPIGINNGGDSALWTPSAISGSWDFESTDESHTGSQSVDATSTLDNSTAQFAKGSAQDLTGHVAITGWIYLTKFAGASGMILYGWDTGTVSIVGNEINIADYISVITFNEWQQFIIPLEDLGIVGDTIDAIRVRTQKGVGTPDYYLDDVQIEQLGGSVEFSVKPDLGETGFVSSINITIIDDYTGVVAGAYPTMPSIPYNTFLGVASLSSGILFRQFIKGKTSSFTFKHLSDFMNLPSATLHSFGSDGTNTWLNIRIGFEAPLKLIQKDEDEISFTIQDDMSGLLQFRASVNLLIEEDSD